MQVNRQQVIDVLRKAGRAALPVVAEVSSCIEDCFGRVCDLLVPAQAV
jgi:hypothetical protein